LPEKRERPLNWWKGVEMTSEGKGGVQAKRKRVGTSTRRRKSITVRKSNEKPAKKTKGKNSLRYHWGKGKRNLAYQKKKEAADTTWQRASSSGFHEDKSAPRFSKKGRSRRSIGKGKKKKREKKVKTQTLLTHGMAEKNCPPVGLGEKRSPKFDIKLHLRRKTL